jgi:MinD-like ATPase involved in chromosome partitioning or flagellar assembly
MEMISILLLDADRAYAARLAARLATADRRFSVTVGRPETDGTSAAGGFLTEESPACAAGGVPADGSPVGPAGSAYDFVIMDEAVPAARDGRAEDFGGARPVILSESAPAPESETVAVGTLNGARCAPDARGFLYAKRYGRVGSLVALLRAEYAARPGQGGFSQGGAGGVVKYIGCFGLGGGCGASSIAIGIGRDFAAYKGKRALYVSLETLEATGLCVRAAEGDRHVGDFLYLMLRGRAADLRLFAESCLFRDSYGLARFFPSPGMNDLARASPEECGEFLRFLDGCGDFDLIVLDLGGDCKDLILKAVRLCDALVLISNGSLADAGKRARATALLQDAWGRDDATPVFATNMLRPAYDFDEEAPAEAKETRGAPAASSAPASGPASADAGPGTRIDPEIRINRDDASFRYEDGVTDFVLSGEFGASVRELTDILSARICE